MKVTIAPPVPQLGDYDSLKQDESRWLYYFADIMAADPRLRGRVLDVGCGPGPAPDCNQALMKLPAQLDGVEPGDSVQRNPYLTERWQGFFEQVEQIPAGAYDAIISFQVVEHVERPEEFLRAVYRALRPGGVFYAHTPHGNHPFAFCVRALDILKLKQLFNKGDGTINEIPSFYRLNRRRALTRMGKQTGFNSLEILYYPNIGWRYYMPKPARFIAAIYDRLFASRVNRMSMLMMYKLEKPGASGVVAPPMAAPSSQWRSPSAERTPAAMAS